MKCREMNPGNVQADAQRLIVSLPSMKCREMNPGNHDSVNQVSLRTIPPSMKCREMNPGNSVSRARSTRSPTLNEVPGNESRQSVWQQSQQINSQAPQ